MYDFSIIARNYKCFFDTVLFNELKRVNLIIGRNNVGKSSILDILEMVCSNSYSYRNDHTKWKNGNQPEIAFICKIDTHTAEAVFSRHNSGGVIGGNHFRNYGKYLIDEEVEFTKFSSRSETEKVLSTPGVELNPPLSNLRDYSQKLIRRIAIPLEGKQFKKLSSERDITAESSDNRLSIDTRGNGITNVIQQYLNSTNHPSEFIEEVFLRELNTVYAQDASFSRILSQQWPGNQQWEVFLEEEAKGRIPLSRSGNGLKTVISVLSYLILLPEIENKKTSDYVFAFEELENNLHPALLRRLSNYIYEKSREKDFIYFITSHSNVLIDQFSKQEDAQIIHVQQKNGEASCRTAKTYYDNNGILDDLDVRASDLLQANGIIWVEGPSDRIYLNRWIELWSEGTLREGTHYQIIFYGGRLLAHLDANDPEKQSNFISILTANRNAALVIDSDKKSKNSHINSTKRRIKDELESSKCFCWITKGREIENYVPEEVVNSFFNKSGKLNLDPYMSLFDKINEVYPGKGDKYRKKKPLFAEGLIQYMNLRNLPEMLDLNEKMTQLCKTIISWNQEVNE